MIVPSIDIMDGQAVQLVGGEKKVLDAGDPRPLARRFGRVGEIAVIDLDAALGRGSNAALIEELCALARCRVGGGIRDVESARAWLDRGAVSVILGTAARPELLAELPRERVYAALDARHGEVVVEGWTKGTGRSVLERIEELRPLVAGFLVTLVEREGRLEGIDLDVARRIREAAGDAALTMAGGVTTTEEIAALDELDADAQVGMALYTGRMGLAEGFLAPLAASHPAPWPTVVADERGGALGLAWSDAESVAHALESGRGTYHSRRRGLWVKGESSGASQELLEFALDCDRDALLCRVRQAEPGFCHEDTWTCWGEARGLRRLERTLRARREDAPRGSYTRRLFDDPELLAAKLVEEAGELAEARGAAHVAEEGADLLYFTLVALTKAGVDLAAAEEVLERRARRISRRRGDAKKRLDRPQ